MLQRNLPHLSYTLIMQAESFPEMMVHSYHTTQHLYNHCHENLKSHMRMLGILWNKQTWYHNISINKIYVFMPKTVIMIIFWDVVPCSLITFQRSLLSLFSEQKCHWAAGSSKTLLPIYKTIQRYIPQYQILDNFSYTKQHSLIKT